MKPYRWRTWLREHGVPVRKGYDCGMGRHELYLARWDYPPSGGAYAVLDCYHCGTRIHYGHD